MLELQIAVRNIEGTFLLKFLDQFSSDLKGSIEVQGAEFQELLNATSEETLQTMHSMYQDSLAADQELMTTLGGSNMDHSLKR